LSLRLHTLLIAAGALILGGSLAVWALTERQSAMVAMSGVFLILTGALGGAQLPRLVATNGNGAS
jgi:hypothetical protein